MSILKFTHHLLVFISVWICDDDKITNIKKSLLNLTNTKSVLITANIELYTQLLKKNHYIKTVLTTERSTHYYGNVKYGETTKMLT